MSFKNSAKSKSKVKLPFRVKINIAIFAALAILFAVLPNTLFISWLNVNNDQPDYQNREFSYILYDICPCYANEENYDSCSGYWACGADKANITYNMDNAPEDQLQSAKRDAYFEGMLESNRLGTIAMRVMLLRDISYILSFISLIAGFIYWNHNKAQNGTTK